METDKVKKRKSNKKYLKLQLSCVGELIRRWQSPMYSMSFYHCPVRWVFAVIALYSVVLKSNIISSHFSSYVQ